MGEIYYVGIDLGTSRTSIATSTGVRLTTITCVGYAKDMITKKRFGKDYLLGQEALDNRLGLNMVWPLGAGVIENNEAALKATRLILQNVVAQAIPDKKPEDKIYAAIGVPARASVESKKHILEVSKGFIDKVMVVSEPFAVAYSLDKLYDTLIVDIGAGSSDVSRIEGSIPTEEAERTIEIAGNYLDSCIEAAILEKYPNVQLTKNIVKNLKEKYGYVSKNSDPIIATLTEAGKPSQYDITEIMRESCLKLTDPICATVQELIAHADADFQAKFRNNVIVAGGGSRLKGIDRAIEKSLEEYGGGNAICVQDSEFCGAIGNLRLSIECPDEMWDELT